MLENRKHLKQALAKENPPLPADDEGEDLESFKNKINEMRLRNQEKLEKKKQGAESDSEDSLDHFIDNENTFDAKKVEANNYFAKLKQEMKEKEEHNR